MEQHSAMADPKILSIITHLASHLLRSPVANETLSDGSPPNSKVSILYFVETLGLEFKVYSG